MVGIKAGQPFFDAVAKKITKQLQQPGLISWGKSVAHAISVSASAPLAGVVAVGGVD